MKRIILTLSIFFFSISCLLAQTLYTRTDTLAITTDSVTLQAGTFRGAIQWQRSLDGNNWDNLTGKTGTFLKVAQANEGFYRAAISEGTCLPTYSDTAVIVANQPASTQIADPNNIEGTVFVERDGGSFTFTGSAENIPVNTVFVDNDRESDIRVVTNVSQNGDTLIVETKQGTLEDLFMNTEFKLSTQVMPPTLKSTHLSSHDLARAMVDGKGVIRPVEVIDNNAKQPMLKSAQDIDESLPGIYFKNDFSGETIWKEGGASITFEEAYYQLGAELEYEFKFEQQPFDWQNFQFPNGKLTKFKVNTKKEATGIEAKMLVKTSTSKEFEKEDSKVIKKDVFNKTFKYLVIIPPNPVPIPFWATVKVDLMRGSSSNISGEATVTGGATGSFNLEIGASYENGAWSTIKPSFTPELNLEGPDVDAKVNVQAQVEVYPRIEVSFYSMLAPYMDIAPYIRSELEYSLTGNYKYDLYSGVNARLGVKAGVFGNDIFDYTTDDLNLYEKSLYTAPQKVKVVIGANQKASAGKPLPEPIVLKVVDSEDNPVKNTLVNVKASMGKLSDALLASPEGASLNSGLLYANNADSTKLAVASDTTGQVKINWTLADSTAIHELEAYLKNGKDSIREDTRVTFTADVDSCGCDESRFEYFTDPRDGNVYKTIKIGNQTWMAENLSYLPYTTPTSTYSYTEPCYYVYDRVAYGVLYNWPAALNACPAGWHLPSDAEWTTLSNYLGGESVAGGKMKATTGWNSPNTGATNESCFSALPGGNYYNGDGFFNSGNYGFWWSSTASDENYAWNRNLSYFNTWLNRRSNFRYHGVSVRCVRD